MSRDRFDVLDRFEPLFQVPEPSFERFLRRRGRKQRNQRMAAGAVGIAVFLAAVWAVTSGGPLDRGSTPGSSGPTDTAGLPPHPVGVGLLDFPPEGATPSAPERGEVVVGFVFGHTDGDPGRFGLHVYADGRVIWARLGNRLGGANVASTGLIEQRLTPEGVNLVVAEVLSTGLFGGDSDAVIIGPLESLHYGSIEVRTDRLEHLTWGDAGFRKGRLPHEIEITPEDVATLERLDARLEDLGSWLPASAWADAEYRAYVPVRYQVCYGGFSQALERSSIMNLLPAPVEGMLRPLETSSGEWRGPLGPIPYWCSTVRTDDARTAAGVLEAAGASRNEPESASYRLSRRGGPEIDIGFDPLLPHG